MKPRSSMVREDGTSSGDITVPLLTPTIFFATIMALIASFQVFEQTYIMTQGGPGKRNTDARLPDLPQRLHLSPHGLRLSLVLCPLRHSVRHHDRPGADPDKVGALCVILRRAP